MEWNNKNVIEPAETTRMQADQIKVEHERVKQTILTTRIQNTHRAFSLAELMIAIVILGVGLMMVASMFPIAWMKARDQVEAANVATATDTAEATLLPKLELKSVRDGAAEWISLSCDGVSSTAPPISELCDPCGSDKAEGRATTVTGCFEGQTSFSGDLGIFPYVSDNKEVYFGTDSRVHPVNMYNMLVSPTAYDGVAPETFMSGRNKESSWVDFDCIPFDNDPMDFQNCNGNNTPLIAENAYVSDYNPVPASEYPLYSNGSGFPFPQVAFEERLIPPMPLWPSKIDNDLPGDADDANFVYETWKADFRNRRYAWSALSRLNNGASPSSPLNRYYEGTGYILEDPSGSLYTNDATWTAPRIFTMYYVTLRRAQENFRFPRQMYNGYSSSGGISSGNDNRIGKPRSVIFTASSAGDDPNDELADIAPSALPANRDTAFPVPWRIPVEFFPSPAPGVPSEARVYNDVAAYLLPREAYLIEEETGVVYQIANHTPAGNGAILTLSKSFIPPPDIVQQINDAEVNGTTFNWNSAWCNVWVYPPPCEAERVDLGSDVNLPMSTGKQPVVGIEVKTTVLNP